MTGKRDYARFLLSLFVVLWPVLAGCGLLDDHSSDSANGAAPVKIEIAPSPTDTQVPQPMSPTATISSNQEPRATVSAVEELCPTSTAMPSPTTAVVTPESELGPPRLFVKLDPELVSQGNVLVISIWARPGLSIKGVHNGQELIFAENGHRYWSLAGIELSHEPGSCTLQLMATDVSGQATTVITDFQVIEAYFPTEGIDLPSGQLQLLDPELVEAESERLQRLFQVFTAEKLWRGLFVWPTEGTISSAFGTQRSYNGGPVTGHHQGVDISAPVGTPVMAANDGEIVLAQPLRLRGNAIMIDHGVGVHSAYYHLSEIEVEEGQLVTKGQIIGEVGETGLATGPHLHWELRVGGISVDPAEWVEREIGLQKLESDYGDIRIAFVFSPTLFPTCIC